MSDKKRCSAEPALASCWNPDSLGAEIDLPGATPESYPAIPGYEIIGEVGRGGMGLVFKARKPCLDRAVAIKVIRKEGFSNPELARRFRRETRAAARLSHPNIVSVYDAGVTESTYFLVMEFVEGIDLQRLVDTHGPLPVDVACDYVRQAALGLQHAHEQGLVHRDIKPANLIVEKAAGGEWWLEKDRVSASSVGCAPGFGTVKLLDLGLARLHDTGDDASSGSLLTQEGTIVGTPDFIAPEQVENSHGVDVRADLYSLGCTFYFLLVGQTPFSGKTLLEKLDQHRWRKPRPVERLRREVPREVSAVIQKLLAKSAAERYQTPHELADALTAILARGRGRLDSDGDSWAKAETKEDISLNTPPHLSAHRALQKEMDNLQKALVDCMERNANGEALELAEAMLKLKPNDSLACTTRAYLEEQLDRASPVGECARFDLEAESVSCVAVSPDGTRLAAGSGNTIYLYDLPGKSLIHALESHRDVVRSLTFSPDGRSVLSGSKDETIRLWDAGTGQMMRKFRRHTEAVNSVAFAPSGRAFFSAGGDKAAYLCDVNTGHRLARMRGHGGDVKSVTVSADGRTAITASWDHTVRIWNVETGAERQRFSNGLNYFTTAVISADGCRAFAGGSDNVIYLWSAETGQEIRKFEGHSNWIMSVALSPDGRRMLSGGYDGTVRLWDVESGRELHCFQGHSNWVLSVAFAPDGRHAVSGGADRTVRVWKLPR